MQQYQNFLLITSAKLGSLNVIDNYVTDLFAAMLLR